jgi:hypothetical protein
MNSHQVLKAKIPGLAFLRNAYSPAKREGMPQIGLPADTFLFSQEGLFRNVN